MEEATLVGLVRAGWPVLTFAMLFSRFLFQAAGSASMRAPIAPALVATSALPALALIALPVRRQLR